MKLTSHLGRISWSLADKGLYVIYGFVQLMQFNALPTEVYGVFSLLVGLNTWIMLVSDGSALQGVIQFGSKQEERGRVNAIGLTTHAIISLGAAALVFLFREPLATQVDKSFVDVAMLLPLYVFITLPRMFCLKLIYREMKTKNLFFVDFIWFGVRIGLTLWMLSTNSLNTLEDIVIIDFAGMAASSLAAIVFTWRDIELRWKGNTTLKEYLRFGVPLALASALNSTPRQLDVLIIASFFGVSTVGIYSMAKNWFRLFEQAFDAVTVLLYPAAVRMYSQHRMEDLQLLITKAISVTLVPTLIALIVLELGASHLIVAVLGDQYAPSVVHFNVLILGTLGMPFLLMASVIAAMGHSIVVVRYSAVGLVVGLAVLFGVGAAGWESAVGLGLASNAIVVGLLCTMYVRNQVPFPISALARSFTDIKHVLNKVK